MTRRHKQRLLIVALLAAIGAFAIPLVFDRSALELPRRDEFRIPPLPAKLTAIPFAAIDPKKTITPLIDKLPAEGSLP